MYFDTFFQFFFTLDERKKQLAEDVDWFANTRAITLAHLLEKTNAPTMITCLKQETFDITNLLDAVHSLKILRHYPNDDEIGHVREYMSKLAEVKKSMKVVESLSKKRPRRGAELDNPVMALNQSQLVAENIAVCTRALNNLAEIQEKRDKLRAVGTNFDVGTVQMMTQNQIDKDFINPKPKVEILLKETDEIEKMAKEAKSQSLLNMSMIFLKIGDMKGLKGSREKILELAEKNDKYPYKKAVDEWKTLGDLNLDFAVYESRLKDGYSSTFALVNFFDTIFGRAPTTTNGGKQPGERVVVEKSVISWIAIIGTVIGIAVITPVIIIVVYGFTKNGKNKYKKLWIFYFGKPEDYEKRWRYSLFYDSDDGLKHGLLDAIREQNFTNTMAEIKRGAYINAYNQFGNTGLHVTTKAGQPEFVEALIKHGADRTLLNWKNKTPIECIPADFEKNCPEKADKYREILAIYKKYEKKKFRHVVPDILPWTSFHITIDESVDETLTNKFCDEFSGITTNEPIPNLTHCIVKVDKDGVMEATTWSIILFFFRGVIMVKESWISACLADKKQIMHDDKHLVEKVRYKGEVFNTVKQWAKAMAKADIPFLFGIYCGVVMTEYPAFSHFVDMVTNQGATLDGTFPLLAKFRPGSRGYNHANRGPLFLIYDESSADIVTGYRKEPMYSIFNEDEFLKFMFRREIHVDKRKDPPTVLLEDE